MLFNQLSAANKDKFFVDLRRAENYLDMPPRRVSSLRTGGEGVLVAWGEYVELDDDPDGSSSEPEEPVDQKPRPQRTASTKKHGAKRANSVKANGVTRRVVMFALYRQANKPGDDSLSMFHVQYQRGDGTCSPGWI